MIHTLRLRLSNVHLAVGERAVLFDTGSPGDDRRIIHWMQSLGHFPPAAIMLTHAHADHAGAAVALRAACDAPLCLAKADWQMAQAGRNPLLRVSRPSAIPLAYLVPHLFAPFTPDIALGPDNATTAFGISCRILATPGHTPGSISAVFPDGQAIVGDLLMGGFLGGMILPQRPREHYFVVDKALNAASLAALLATGAKTLHVGHGGPVDAARIRAGRQP